MKNIAVISTFQNAEVQTVTNRRQKKQKTLCEIHCNRFLCVIHYNRYVAGLDKKGWMLQMYLEEDENK